jgi:hypothetical protein
MKVNQRAKRRNYTSNSLSLVLIDTYQIQNDESDYVHLSKHKIDINSQDSEDDIRKAI